MNEKFNVLDFLIKSRVRVFFIIILVALLTRVIVYFTTDNSTIFADSYTYHVLALNLAKGNGYSTNLFTPYEPNFTRDPAYPFFMSLVYRAYHVFHELTITPFNTIALTNADKLMFSPDEMLWIRLVQIILASLSCIFYYLILLYVFKPKYALLLTLLFAIYFPYSYNDLYILRESFQSSLAIIANYFFISFLVKDKTIYIVIFGILWGILNLTLQTSLILGFLFPIIIIISTRNYRKTIIATLIATFVMLLTIFPYLVRAYKFYPDIRVVRSMGNSITLEKSHYYKTFIKLKELGYISQYQFDSLKIELWSLPEYQTFEKSFNGNFYKLSEELRTKYNINSSIETKYKLNNIVNCAKKVWLLKFYRERNLGFIYHLKNLEIIMLTPYILSFLFGLLAFAGFVIYLKNTYYLLLIFFSIVSIFFIIGDEYRRALPAHPYIFMFGVLMIITLFNLYKKKSLKEIRVCLFNESLKV